MSRIQKTPMNRLRGNNGYVTLAVLLIVGLLAAIVSSLLSVSRPALGLARIGGDEVAAEGLVQGGIATAGFLLIATKRDPARVNGMDIRLSTGDIRLTVVDEAGRVDLNSADPTLLAGLFSAAGGKSLSNQAFASRVVDWRDKDSDVGIGGAEVNEYSSAELGYVPPNLPFHSVEELRFLLGLSARDFERLAPHVTVLSGRAKIDPLAASETVIRAIPGSRKRDFEQILRAKRSGRGREQIIASIPTLSEFLLAEPSGVYRVGVKVKLTDGFSDAVEAVIAAPKQGDTQTDYRVVGWTRLASAAAE
jgi:general secretion pathway protein K